MIESLITSRTRVKLLYKFFINSNVKSYLRELEVEFGESTNAIRVELNRFEKAGLLVSSVEGNKKLYQANTSHPFFNEINHIIWKSLGIDQIVDRLTTQAADLKYAFLTGDLAQGISSKIFDVMLVGSNPDREAISKLFFEAENLVKRKIRYFVVNENEMGEYVGKTQVLMVWENPMYKNKHSSKGKHKQKNG